MSHTTHAPAKHSTLPAWAWLLVPLTALHILLPMMHHGFSCGHDLTFHLTNWFDAAQQWRHGNPYPRWAQSPNWTAGEPRFIFYPPASWMLGAAIAGVSGLAAAPYVYLFLVLCAAAVGMYRLARLVLWPAAALAAALLYMANPYMLFVVYTRSAYAELLAAAIFPLLLLAVLRPRVHIALLAETVAAIWLTNAPAAVIAMYSLAVLAILAAWRHRSLPNLGKTLAGTALGMGVAAIYILPAAYERRWVQIARVKDAAYNFRASFLFGHSGEALHDAVLRQASWIAVALLLVVALCTLVLLSQARQWHTLQRRVFFVLAILAAVILMLLLPVSAFVWQHAPEMAFLQFPWRWLLALAPIAALLLAAVFGAHTLRRRIPLGVALIVSVLMTSAGAHLYFQQCDPQDTPRGVTTILRSGAGVEGTDEYTPVNADTDDLQPAAPQVWFYPANEVAETNPSQHHALTDHASVAAWAPQYKHFSVTLAQPSVAILQLMDYPAWAVRVDGKPAAKAADASSGQLQIALPAGHSDVELKFDHTRDRIAADVLSALCLLLLGFVTWWERHAHFAAPSHPRKPPVSSS